MLNEMAGIVRKAGDIILQSGNTQVHEKAGHFNYVTETDIAVQSFLQEKLTALMPDSVFLAEEKENSALTSLPTWVIDPIDGTMNFIRGRRCSCISAALLINGLPVMGIVFNPYANEMFTAERGKGASLNNVRIYVSQTPFEKALITFGTSPYDANLANETMQIAAAFLRKAGDLRRTGSAAIDLADIACGRADVFFELKLSPWDYSAGALLVEEAGGYFYMPRLKQLHYGQTAGILACNVTCAKTALEMLTHSEACSSEVTLK